MVLLSLLAAVPAVFMPLAAAAQAAPAERPETSYKYEASVGYGYTSLNQVNQSRYGLQGVDASVARYFGKYFAVDAQGDYYKPALNTGGGVVQGNPGDPVVESFLAGPLLRAPIYGRVDAYIKILVGAEHTGGESMSPSTSAAGGFGGGFGYRLSPHFALRATGEKIGASFSLRDNSSTLAYSSHMTWNSRAALSLVYRF
jgi:hypothetical protein